VFGVLGGYLTVPD